MYEIGRVYIWQNQVGEWTWLNGAETTVTGPKSKYMNAQGRIINAWPTDTQSPMDGHFVGAFPGDLRPRDTPSGERSVMEQFRQAPEHDVLRELDEAVHE